MGKRQMLGHILSIIPAGASRGARTRLQGNYLTVLTYHRILDQPDHFPFDSDLISASVENFTYQLSYLSRNYDVINFRMLDRHLEEYGRLPEGSLIITFDDGYVDNYEIAFPLLQNFGLTATMFVTAGFIGTARCFWWDKIAYIVKKAGGGKIRMDRPVKVDMDLGPHSDRQGLARSLIKAAKKLPEREKECMIEELADQLGVSIAGDLCRYTMSWEQVRELNRGGIEIGAHSVNHPIFSNVDGDELRTEIVESKRIIERELNAGVITFGAPGRGIIPAGEKERFEELLEEYVREAGYRFSTRYRWGLVHEKQFHRYAIKRIGIEIHDSKPLFRAKLNYPEILVY